MHKHLLKILPVFIFIITFKTFSQETPEEKFKVLYEKNDFKAIITEKDKFAENEFSANAFYYIAISYYDEENYQDAIIYFDKAIAKGPAEGKMYYFCALSYREMNNKEKAIEYLDLAIANFPERSTYPTEKAEILLEFGKQDEAIALLNDALTKERVTGKAYYLLGQIFYKNEENKKALEILYKGRSKTEKDDESYLPILYQISLIEYMQGSHTASIEAVTELLSMNPEAYLLYPLVIQNYFALNKLDSAKMYQKKLYRLKKEGKLTKDLSEKYCFERFKWNGKWVYGYEYYKIPDPEKDVRFHKHVYVVLNKEMEEEFTVQTEFFVFLSSADDIMYVLGASKYADEVYYHSTYATLNFKEPVDYKKLKEGVMKILDNKVEPTSSSKSKKKD